MIIWRRRAHGLCSATIEARTTSIACAISVFTRRASGSEPRRWLQLGQRGVSPLALQLRIQSARQDKQKLSGGQNGAIPSGTLQDTARCLHFAPTYARDRQQLLVAHTCLCILCSEMRPWAAEIQFLALGGIQAAGGYGDPTHLSRESHPGR